jgi:hypothetical protein
MASTPGIAHLIDEASFQHDKPINYGAVVSALALEYTGGADPATFATPVYVGIIVKLTEGDTYVNPYAIEDAKGFAAVDQPNVTVLVWYYHFVHSMPSADAQINWAIKNATFGTPRIWMDVEAGGIDSGQGWTDLVNTATAMLAAPCAVGLYTNLSGLSHFPNRAAGVANLWLADPSDASPGTRRSITQVGQGTVAGIDGPVDLDTAEVSVLTLIPAAVDHSTAVTATETPTTTTTDLTGEADVIEDEHSAPEATQVLPATTQPAAEPGPNTGSTVAHEVVTSTVTPAQEDPMSLLKEYALQTPMEEGPQVKVLQTLLRDMHGLIIAVDGWYGPITEGAVKSFQDSVHIAVDGIVGPITWGRLLDA